MFRELLKKQKQISMEECIHILKEEKRGVLSVNGDGGYPYGMPMNHFYNEENGKIYFHCGNIPSHRMDAIKKDNKVSFCVYNDGEQKEGHWALYIKSVIVFGKMELITDLETVADISRKLSYKFTQDESFIQEAIEQSLHMTVLLELTPEHICGKLVEES